MDIDDDDEPVSNEENQGYSHINDEVGKPKKEEVEGSRGTSTQRGMSLNPENKNLRMKDKKIVLRYNAYGVPCGLEAATLSTFLGVLAHTSMPITIKIGDYCRRLTKMHYRNLFRYKNN